MAQHSGGSRSSASGPASASDRISDPAPGKVDLVSILYVAGGIPAILAFLVLLFGVGVRFCGLPA